MDNFYEQLLKVDNNFGYKTLNVLTYAFLVLALMFLFALNIPIAIASALLSGLSFSSKKNLMIEYEYAFTNGEVDVDKIIDMRKRKRLITFKVKEIEILAPKDNEEVSAALNNGEQRLKAYNKEQGERTYIAVINSGGKKINLYFQPDEKFLELCYKYNPRAVRKN